MDKRFVRPVNLDEDSVNSEQIYVEQVEMPPNRQTAQVLLQYYKEKYAMLVEVCKGQQAKLEQMTKMQDYDTIQLQNSIYEARTQMNNLRQVHLIQMEDMHRKLERIQQYHDYEIAELRQQYENRIADMEQPEQQALEGVQNDKQQQNQMEQLTNMVEQLQRVNSKVQKDKMDAINEINRLKIEHKTMLEKQRQQLTMNFINLTKTSATNQTELIEYKRQLNKSTDNYQLLLLEHNKVKQDKEAAQKLVSTLMSDNSRLKQQIVQLQQQLEKQHRMYEQALKKQDTSSYSHILEDSKTSETDLRQQLSKLRNEYDAQMSILYKKEVQLKEERDQRVAKEQQLSRMKQQNMQLKNNCQIMELEVQRLKKTVAEKDKTVASIHKDCIVLENTHRQELQLLKDQLNRLSDCMNASQKASMEDRARLLEDIGELKNQVAMKEAELIHAKLDLEYAQDSLQQEKNALSDIKKRYYDLQQQCFQESKMSDKPRGTSPRPISLNSESNIELKEENRSLVERINNMEEQYQRRLLQVNLDMQAAVDDINDKCLKMRQQIEDKERQAQHMNEVAQELRRMHTQQMVELRKQMQESMEEASKKLKARNVEYDQLYKKHQKETVEMNNRLQHKQRQLQEHKYMVESVTAEKERLQKRIAFQTQQLQIARERANHVDESKLKISKVDDEQIHLKDQQIDQLRKERQFYQQQCDRIQKQLQKMRQEQQECHQNEQKYQQQIEKLREQLTSLDTAFNVQKTVQERVKMTDVMEEEIRRCHELIEQLRREQHDKSMLRKDNHEQQVEKVLNLERQKQQLGRQLAQHKLQLSNANNKQRFMELKLQDMIREKEAAIAIGRHKRALEEQLKNREEEIKLLHQQMHVKDQQNDKLRHQCNARDNVVNSLRLKSVQQEKQMMVMSEQLNNVRQCNSKIQGQLAIKEAESKQLVVQLHKREQTVPQLKQMISQLQSSIKYEAEVSKGNRKDIQSLEDQIVELQKQLAYRQERIVDLETVERHLGKVIAQKQNKEQQLIRAIENRQEHIHSVEQQLSQLKREFSQLKGQCQHLKMSRVRADRQAQGSRNTNEKISNQHVMRLKLEVDTLSRQLEKAKHLRQHHEQRIRQYMQQIDSLKADKSQCQNRLLESESRGRELDRRVSQEQTNSKRLKQEIKIIKEQTEFQRLNHEKLMQQFEILKAKNVRQIESLQSTVEEMNNKLKEEKKYYEQKNSQRLKDQQQYARLSQDFNKLQSHCTGVQKQIVEISEAYGLLEKDNHALVSQVKILQQTNGRLENMLAQRDTQAQMVQQKVKALNEEIERLKYQNSTVTFKDFGRDDNEMVKEKEKLAQLVEQLQKQNKHLRETAKTRNSSSAIRYGDTRSSIESMHEVQNLRSIIRTLENQNKMLGMMKSENMRLNSQVGRLIAQNHSLIENMRKLQTEQRDPNHSHYLETIQNLQMQINRLSGRINSRHQVIVSNPQNSISRTEHSRPEYVVSSPLEFGSVPAYQGQMIPVRHQARNWNQAVSVGVMNNSQSVSNSRNY